MFSIKDYLEKVKNITPPDVHVRDNVSLVLKEKTGIEVPRKSIKVQKNVVYIQESNATKAYIFLQKKIILRELEIKIGKEKTPIDIR